MLQIMWMDNIGIRVSLYLTLVIAVSNACSNDEIADKADRSGKNAIENANLGDFNVVFHRDLEETPDGPYDLAQFNEDWNTPRWKVGRERTLISDYNIGNRSSRGMRWDFPEGTYGGANAGYGWPTPLYDSYEEAYLSYSVLMRPGFEPVKGGKIMGLQGGKQSSPPKFTDGFAALVMFKKGPRLNWYLYHIDQPGEYGELLPWDHLLDVSSEIWHDITYRVVMNTATATDASGPEGLHDGILEGYVDGKLISKWTGLRFRNLKSIGIDVISLSGFFGGSGERFAAIRDEWWWLDNFYVWTYSDEYLRSNPSIKRGRQENDLGHILYTPIDLLHSEN